TFDYAAMLMGAEQAQRSQQVTSGIPVNDETMALDLIHQVGPGGEYMTQKHTFDHMREMSSGKLFNRLNRDAWEKKMAGSPIEDQAYAEAKRILDTHEPMPLPEGATEKIDALIQAYEEELQA
ncbi:MAG: trimethylamine methyltransferase family protein, partial [Desulfovibrionales bacterium]|nr:trimethylamine methyltransferase family protein [Desulfovibrionales bacterium]